MLATILATICFHEVCIEKIVTTQATLMECNGATAAQAIPQWLEAQGYTVHGWTLQSWRCEIGGRRRDI